MDEELRARISELEAEVADLRARLDGRKKIERAKGVLMRRLRIGEEVAYRMLQRRSMDTRVSLVVLAERILDGREPVGEWTWS